MGALMLACAAVWAGAPPKIAPDAVDAPHVHVQLVAPKDQIYPGGENQVGLYFKLEPGWHVYWKNAGDSGEPPQIRWALPDGVTAEAMQFPAPQRLPLGPLMDFGYENEVLFPVKLDVAPTVKQGKAVLDAHVNWLICREVCIPGKAELATMLDMYPSQPPVVTGSAADAELMKRLASTLPTAPPAGFAAVFQATKDGFRLGITTGKRERRAVFFPADQNVLDNPAPQKARLTAQGVVLDLTKDANLTRTPAELGGVLELGDGRAYTIAAVPGIVKVGWPWAEILRSAALAFLGGLLLNLMPCVFPVLFLKGLALVNSGNEERNTLRAHGFVYAAGIVASFWALVGALLGLRAAGATLGWGFQFQSPVFLSLMAGLLFFIGLSLAGQFEMGLTLTSAGGGLAAKQGYTGSFFTGVLAVVVATPCTAPFMAGAIGYALAQPAAVTFAVFTALALGLAAPYCRADAAAGVDAAAAQAGRVDGGAAAGGFRAGVCDGDLAGVGAGAGVRGGGAGGGADGISAAGGGGVVSGTVAGAALGDGGGRSDCAGGDCAVRGGSGEVAGGADNGDGNAGGGAERGAVAGVVGRTAEQLPGGGTAGAGGLYRELVPELPGE